MVYIHTPTKGSKLVDVTENESMQKIKMIRGSKNQFFFIEQDQFKAFDIIYELKL